MPPSHSIMTVGQGRFISDRDEHVIHVKAVDTDGDVTTHFLMLESDTPSVQPAVPTVVKISGDNQQGAINARLAQPIVIELRDEFSNPLTGEPVVFRVTAGEGRLSGRHSTQRAITDANGRVELFLTLGPNPGNNVVTVNAVSSSNYALVRFSASAISVPTVPISDGDYRKWHLPDGVIHRFGKGHVSGTDKTGVWPPDGHSLAISPDGQSLAVASGIGVWLYDVATFRELSLLPTKGKVYAMSFSRDGSTLAAGLDTGTIKLWNVASGTNIATLSEPPRRGAPGWINSVSFSPDGRLLASASTLDTINLWDLESGLHTATLAEGRQTGSYVRNSVLFSPNGSILASSAFSPDGASVNLWDVATRTQIAVLSHKQLVTSVAFSPDGRTLASGSVDETVNLWNLVTNQNIASLKHPSPVDSISFSPDGRTLVAGLRNGPIELWNLTARTKTSITGTDGGTSVLFSPDGSTLFFVVGEGHSVVMFDMATGTGNARYGHINVAHSTSFSPDGRALATAAKDGIVRLWDVNTGQEINRFLAATDESTAIFIVTFSPDGALLACGWGDSVILWDVATGGEFARFDNPIRYPTLTLEFSPDGRTLAEGRGDGIVVWGVATGARIATPVNQLGNAVVSYAPDGRTIASGSRDGMVRLWDASTLTQIAAANTPRGFRIWSISYSPDGTILATGIEDGTVLLWDVSTLTQIATIDAGFVVDSVDFSPDGTTLASGSWDRTVRLWDVKTRQNIATLEGHTGSVTSVEFSPDGKILASGSGSRSKDGTVLLWDVQSPQLQSPTLEIIAGNYQRGVPGNCA